MILGETLGDLLGENLLQYLVLAFGAAMAIGTFIALVRPPADRRDRSPAARDRRPAAPAGTRAAPGRQPGTVRAPATGPRPSRTPGPMRGVHPVRGRRRRPAPAYRSMSRPALARSIVFIAVGLFAAVWALATLTAG